ncbi:MAG TPA: PIN domain-containing protein [Chloroflexota bacterium]|nr:PIN domain-containing protein [Chloroflexota bacterium]
MSTAVDSNILLDLASDSEFAEAAQASLSGSDWLVICPVVAAELAGQFHTSRALSDFLREVQIERTHFSDEALWRAGEAWQTYSRRRPRGMHCPNCGGALSVACPTCGSHITQRQHLVADFLIGAHALIQADALITRDPGYYRTYFPELELMVPGQS